MSLLPPEMLAKHTAILGSTGSGKTSVAKCGIVEPTLRSGGRVLVIDPTGAWWGLRVSADGKRAGFPIYIFGGDHGDYPLTAKNAEVLAEAFGTSSDSAVFDTSLMTVTERCSFFTAFASALMRKNRGPVNLIIDEAHLFMPQAGASVGGQVPAMLHAGNNLVSLGRSKGLRVTMITQRPAKLHKDSLTQAQSMIAMRVLSPQDRKAIAEWIAEQADTEKGKEIVASLSSLNAGDAWVWAPLQSHLKRTQFPMPGTFDSSQAPDDPKGIGPVLAPINLDALKGRLATVEADAKANDPRALKAEIARLKGELASMPVRPPADPDALHKARIAGKLEGYSEGVVAAWNEMRRKIEGVGQRLLESVSIDEEFVATHRKRIEGASVPVAKPPARSAMSFAPPPPSRLESSSISPSARSILTVIHKSFPVSLSFDAAARRAGISKRSSAYRSYRDQVTNSGEVVNENSRLRSADGFALSGGIDVNATVEAWASKLPPSYGKMLLAIRNHGSATKEQIAEAAGVSLTSSGLGSGLRELIDLELVTVDGGTYSLAEGLQ